MSARISRTFDFQAATHFEGKFLMSVYNVTLAMDVETDSIREQQVALDRLKYIFGEALMNCVFVDSQETQAMANYARAGIKVSPVPGAPYDQMIALVLMFKLNAVADGKITITHLTLGSDYSDDVIFEYDYSIMEGPFPFKIEGWWTDSTPSVCEQPLRNRGKVVRLVRPCEWSTLSLEWAPPPTSVTEITFSPEQYR